MGASYTKGSPTVQVICECGQSRTILESSKNNPNFSGKCKSCAQTVHGHANTKFRSGAYNAWKKMIARCKRHPHYLKRGIIVCAEWKNDFQSFFREVGDRPSKFHSLDRINTNGNYEPGNVRWATKFEQANNAVNTVYLTAFGITKCLSDWATDNRCNVSRDTLKARIQKGWDHEKAISTPTIHNNRWHGKL